ncbi:MAG TPA: hypothetical protein VF190_09695, partial [Rhodothermales bacterium]
MEAVAAFLASALFALGGGSAYNGTPEREADRVPAKPFEPLVLPVMHVPATDSPIRIDGLLDDEAWHAAAATNRFTEFQPNQKVRPIVETEVFVTHDDRNLYVAFRAYD